jgi:hypothetical protein
MPTCRRPLVLNWGMCGPSALAGTMVELAIACIRVSAPCSRTHFPRMIAWVLAVRGWPPASFGKGQTSTPDPRPSLSAPFGFALPRDRCSIGGRDGPWEGHRGAHRGQSLGRALVDVLHLHEFTGMFLLVLLEVGLILESVVRLLLGADLVPFEADALIGVFPFQVVGGYRRSGAAEGIDLGGELEPGLATSVDDASIM